MDPREPTPHQTEPDTEPVLEDTGLPSAPTVGVEPTPDPDTFPYATWGPFAGLAATFPFAALAIASIGGDSGSSEDVSTGVAIFAQLLQGSLFLSIPAIIAATTAAKGRLVSFTHALGFRRAPIGQSLKWIGLGALAYYAFTLLVVALIAEPKQDDISGKFGPFWVQFLFIALLAPISEEVFFRGLLFGGLRKRMPMIAAAVLSGVLFGAMHAPTGPSAVLPLMFFGIVLAVVYERTGSIWPPIGLHALNNSIVLIALNTT